MRKFRFALVLFLVALVLIPLGGCGQTQTAQTNILHDYFSQDPPGFDPQADTTLMIYSLARELFSTLVRYKGNTLELEPELLAEMPTISPDGLTYTFKLKQGVKFSDGTELTSKDVKFTMERMLMKGGVGQSPWLFEPIKGAKEMEDGTATELAGFKIIDPYTFEITLSYPYAPFIEYLAVPSASILPADYITKVGNDEFSNHPIGTGPFVLDSWTHDTEVVLKKNPNYFEPGLPKLDGIDYRIISDDATANLEFENGNLDVSSIPSAKFDEWTKSGKYQILESTPLNTYYLLFNMKNHALKDVRVRKAIAYAIDKQKILDTILLGHGTLATTFVTPGIPGVDPSKFPGYPYDPEKAKQLLHDAGVDHLSLEIWQIGSTPPDVVVAIQQQLAEVGIDLKITMMDRAAFRQARANGQVPMNYGNWWADFPDPDNYMYTYFHSSQSKSMSSNYNNPKVDQLLNEARTTTDPAKRAAIYQQLEQIIVYDDVAVVPLFHLKDYLAVQPDVHGVIMHPTGVNSYRAVYKGNQGQ